MTPQTIADGMEKIKATGCGMVEGDLAVKMISSDDADDYRVRAMLTDYRCSGQVTKRSPGMLWASD